jgi:hypothetical protein
MDWEIWGPPIAVLGLGLLGGLVAGLRGGSLWHIDQDQADLQARQDSLMQQLRELDAERGKIDEADYQVRKKELVQAAADVLRAMDEGSKLPKAAATAHGATAMKHLPYYALGMVILVITTGIVIQKVATPRVEGGSMTGNAQSAPPSGADPVAEARAAYEADATDLEAINQLTKFALYTQDLDSAMQLMDAGRAVNPDDPGVQVHLGALNSFIGRGAEAEAAWALHEAALPAEVAIWRGIVAARSGDSAAAAAQFRIGVKQAEDPLDREFATFLLADIMSASASAPTSPGGPSEDVEPAAAMVTATLTAEGEVEPGGTLFVYVRSTAVAAGPPTGARKIVDWSLPLETGLGTSDLLPMFGGQWPEQVWIQAKIARSGDPARPAEGDMKSELLGPFPPGASVELVLK